MEEHHCMESNCSLYDLEIGNELESTENRDYHYRNERLREVRYSS